MSGTRAARMEPPQPYEQGANQWRERFRLLVGILLVAMAASLLPAVPSAAQAAPTLATLTSLPSGQVMRVGTALVSPDKKYRATVQSDGNFVIRGPANALIWQSKTAGTGAFGAVMVHGQGEIMLYQTNTASVKWQAGTHGTGPGNRLELRNGGELALLSPGRVTLWTHKSGMTGVKRSEMSRGTAIGVGQSLVSANGKFRVGIVSNGGVGLWGLDGKLKWGEGGSAPTTTPVGNSTLRLGNDSQLHVVGSNGVARWSAGTQWGDVRRVTVTDDGRLIAYGNANALIWSSDRGRVWNGKGLYSGGTAAYQQRVRSLMTTLGCGAVNVKIVPQSGGTAIPTENRVQLENNMAAWKFAYVIAHECAHIKQFRAYNSNVWTYMDGAKRLAALYRTTGWMGIEMNADCIARAQGYTWGHYTKDCSGVRGTAARAILNGQKP